jgi:hypothetical protein
MAEIAQPFGAPAYLPLAQFLRISFIDMLPRSYLAKSHIKLVAALPSTLANLKLAPKFR